MLGAYRWKIFQEWRHNYITQSFGLPGKTAVNISESRYLITKGPKTGLVLWCVGIQENPRFTKWVGVCWDMVTQVRKEETQVCHPIPSIRSQAHDCQTTTQGYYYSWGAAFFSMQLYSRGESRIQANSTACSRQPTTTPNQPRNMPPTYSQVGRNFKRVTLPIRSLRLCQILWFQRIQGVEISEL